MPNESEWQTRKQRIDTRLKKHGRKSVPFFRRSRSGLAGEELPPRKLFGADLTAFIEELNMAIAA
jgi:hypothetical protein